MKYRTSTFVEKVNYLLGKKQNEVLKTCRNKKELVQTKQVNCFM